MLDQQCQQGITQRLSLGIRNSSHLKNAIIRRLIYRSAYKACVKQISCLARCPWYLDAMDDAELDAYEALLDEGDPIIWGWLAAISTFPPITATWPSTA